MSNEQLLPDGVPVTASDRVWDLRAWDGDVNALEESNEAWIDVHMPERKIGTISVFQAEVIRDGELQGFISDGWNEAAEAVGLELPAVVGSGLQTMAVENQIDDPG